MAFLPPPEDEENACALHTCVSDDDILEQVPANVFQVMRKLLARTQETTMQLTRNSFQLFMNNELVLSK